MPSKGAEVGFWRNFGAFPTRHDPGNKALLVGRRGSQPSHRIC
jgi:hypothetical protein